MGIIEQIALTYIFNDKNEVLITRNSDAKGGRWAVPGGHIEFAESILTAAEREAKEEVGINAIPIGIFGLSENVPKDPTKRHFQVFHVICHTKGIDVKLDPKEIAEYVWASPEKAMEIFHDGTYKEIIKEYSAQAKAGNVKWIFLLK